MACMYICLQPPTWILWSYQFFLMIRKTLLWCQSVPCGLEWFKQICVVVESNFRMPHMCLSVRSNFSFISTVGLSLFRDRTVNCGTSCSVWFWFTFFWIWFRSRLHNDSFSPHRPTSWIEILIYYTCTGICIFIITNMEYEHWQICSSLSYDIHASF